MELSQEKIEKIANKVLRDFLKEIDFDLNENWQSFGDELLNDALIEAIPEDSEAWQSEYDVAYHQIISIAEIKAKALQAEYMEGIKTLKRNILLKLKNR